MKTRTWCLILAGLLLVCTLMFFLLQNNTQNARMAEIYSDGKLYTTVDLSVPQKFRICCNGAYNEITVQNGEIFVSQASCSNQVCVQHGACRAAGPIVCLPNKLVIKLSGDALDAPDAVTG